jgi:hypothetical protein
MGNALATFVIVSGLLAMPAVASADTIDLGQAGLAGGANLIGGGSKIQFDAQVSGESATFTLPSIPGEQYAIQVTGHSDASSSFFQFLIDADGSGPGGFVQLGNNFNFGSGFSTLTMPTFTDLGTSDFLRIVNGGTGNTAGQITALSRVAVPGPIVGAGLPGLLMACGWLMLLARRRQQSTLGDASRKRVHARLRRDGHIGPHIQDTQRSSMNLVRSAYPASGRDRLRCRRDINSLMPYPALKPIAKMPASMSSTTSMGTPRKHPRAGEQPKGPA